MRTVDAMTSGKPTAHLVWDWNGTLLHDIDAVLEATNAALARVGLGPLTLARYRELYCVPVPRFYRRMLGRAPTEREWQAMDEAFQRAYGGAVRRAGLAEGAARLLADRQAAGWTQSVCSLAPHEELAPLVRRHGIAQHFLRVDGHPRRVATTGKAAQMARHLTALEGVRAERVVVIGDAVDDARAAAHVGAHAVLYTGGAHSRRSLEAAGVPVVDTLAEATALAERLAAGEAPRPRHAVGAERDAVPERTVAPAPAGGRRPTVTGRDGAPPAAEPTG